jgi:hypothetical protein
MKRALQARDGFAIIKMVALIATLPLGTVCLVGNQPNSSKISA